MEIIKIKSDEHWHSLRAEDLTSTDIAALFDMSPYLTSFELWHRKKDGIIPEFNATERMMWGNRLEQAIAEGIAEDNNLLVTPMKDYYRDTELKLGSSFDYSIDGDNPGILEIKNVDGLVFNQKWKFDSDGNVTEAPAHIELQFQHQLLISGRTHGYIGALVGGNTQHLIKRERDEDICGAIAKKATEFWMSIKLNEPPTVDYERDSSFLMSLYNHAEPGTIIEADNTIEELANEYKKTTGTIKEYTAKKDALKAQLLEKLGEAEKCKGSNFTVSAGITGPKEIPAYTRKGFRNFRISWRKS